MKFPSPEAEKRNSCSKREQQLHERAQMIESATIYLMSKYAARPGIGYAGAVVDHIRMLLNISGLNPGKRELYFRLLPLWQSQAKDRHLFGDPVGTNPNFQTH